METITWDGITIKFYLNRDRTINLRRRMVVDCKDLQGQDIRFLMYPVHDQGKSFGTIKNQIDQIKKSIRDGSYKIDYLQNRQ